MDVLFFGRAVPARHTYFCAGNVCTRKWKPPWRTALFNWMPGQARHDGDWGHVPDKKLTEVEIDKMVMFVI